MEHIYIETPSKPLFAYMQAWLQEQGYRWPVHPDRSDQKYTVRGRIDYGSHIEGIHVYKKKNLLYILGEDTFSYDFTMDKMTLESLTARLKDII